MKVAVLMSTYNGHKYLAKQMESLAKQTLNNDMIIYIRDDGSTDDTLEIIEQWKSKLNIVLYKGKNIGPAYSFWKLFMNSEINADFYAFCDQDDLWDSNKIEKGVSALERQEVEALWCTNCRIIDQNDNVIMDEMNNKSPSFSIISQMVCGTTQGCAMMFNDTLRKYIYSKNIREIPMHDFVVMTYAIAKGKVIYDDSPSFGYRIHANNVVANRGKTVFKHISDLLYNWFSKEHIYENSKYANKLLSDNKDFLDLQTIQYLESIIACKNSLKNRLEIVQHPLSLNINKKAERSFKIKVMLGII